MILGNRNMWLCWPSQQQQTSATIAYVTFLPYNVRVKGEVLAKPSKAMCSLFTHIFTHICMCVHSFVCVYIIWEAYICAPLPWACFKTLLRQQPCSFQLAISRLKLGCGRLFTWLRSIAVRQPKIMYKYMVRHKFIVSFVFVSVTESF